ncbi:MAG TPA: insulinase family protein [Oscillatoriaceae cyanobacterium M33_DOE_052]|uniref:Insulinase family protein n=1 Tax=Planktothricoides sp. SpSt-374 TaxID=2282167 RepID=A0A7C3ZLE9_9CYAN|nr:insulinase family protein [Oscillatoriaceae cyanobacterium M33_DOE_052]
MCQLQTATRNFAAKVLKLESGLTLIHQHLNFSEVVVVDVWVRAGAMREPQEWSGMAHFLEHMIFKGTDKLPPGAFDQAIENRGGMTNAATSHDYAHFFITVAAAHLEETLPVLAELLLHAAIPEDEFFLERDVVLEEIRQSWDNPDWLAFQTLVETVYQRHPYGRPVLGNPDSLMGLSPAAMRQFHRNAYQPENMVVTMVGGVSEDKAVELTNKAFRDFFAPAAIPNRVVEAEPPMTEIRRQNLELPGLELGRLMMAWTGPGVEQLRDAYSLDLLAVLLAEGRTSRLVRELRETQYLVQSISSSFSLQQDSSLFTISAWLEPENLEIVESLICDRLYELQTNLVTEAELNRCQRLLCNDYAFSTETPNQLAGLYGYYETIDRAATAIAYPDTIRSLQPEELRRVARGYISPSYYAVTTVHPMP